MDSPTPNTHLDAIEQYYNDTWFDYRYVWLSGLTNAMHFGYRDGRFSSHSDAVENSNAVCADIAEIKAGDTVLDAGCGLGGSSCWLAQERGAQVIGITPVTEQISRAEKNSIRAGVAEQVRFEKRDYLSTGLPDGSIDVAWAMESLCHATDKHAFYKEMMRLLKPGGRLIIAEYMRSSRNIPEADERDMKRWCDGWVMPDLLTGDEHHSAAAASGFAAIKVQDATAMTRKSLRHLYHRAVIARPLDCLLYSLGLRNDVQHGNAVASYLQYQQLLKGHWFYGLLSAKKE